MEELESDQDAYLGIFYDNTGENTFIKANRKGLERFIEELNKKLSDLDFHLSKEDHFSIINFNKENWFDNESNINLDWIEPTKESRKEIVKLQNEKKEKKWYDGLVSLFWKILLVFLIVCFLIGIFITIKWIFKLVF